MKTTVPDIPANPSPQEIDELATQFARAHLEGEMTRTSALMQLATLLYVSQIPEQVASIRIRKTWGHGAGIFQTRVDLASRLRGLLTTKIMPSEDGSTCLDLHRIASGSSFSGFCREWLSTASASEHRNLDVEYHQTPLASPSRDAEDVDFDVFGAHEAELLAPGADRDSDYDARTAVVEDFVVRSRGSRSLLRLHLQADALCAFYHLPAPTRPSTSAERDSVARAVKDSPQAAFRVAAALARGESPDSPIAAIYDGWSDADLEAIVDADPRTAATLAAAAAAAIPPVPQKVATQVRAEFAARARKSGGQYHLALKTVGAWLVSTSTVGSDPQSWADKGDEQIAAEAAEFTRYAERLLRAGFPGFVTVEEISAWMYQRCDELAALLSQEQVSTKARAGRTAAAVRAS